MPVSIPRLRTWFAFLGIATIVVVAGFYFYARYQVRRTLRELPKKLGVEIQQSTEGFSLSKSEGGKTLFTIRASKAVQYKQGGRATLHDVSIVVYGRNSNRFDQIYGNDFEYDAQAGTVAAKGEVHIDLQGNADGTGRPDQGPPKELQNPIHLMTSGLIFNQKTGIAHTDQLVEFRVPQATGAALGATYNSHENKLTLESKVEIATTGDHPTKLDASSGVITKDPQAQILLNSVRVKQQESAMQAQSVALFIRDNNAIDHITATGDVRLERSGPDAVTVSAPRADIMTTEKNLIRSAVLSGGVQFSSRGEQPADGTAGRVLLDFAGNNKLKTVRAMDNVKVRQLPSAKTQQTVEIASGGLVANSMGGKTITAAETSGPAQITLVAANAPAGEKTVISADKFRTKFGPRGRLDVVRGEGNAKIVNTVPNQPDKISNSQVLIAQFAPGGGISNIVQEGAFTYLEPAYGKTAERRASGDRARYTPEDETLTLTGSPRVVDGGMTVTAQSIRVDRRRGDAFAQGSVKTTYSDIRPDPNGAMLARSEPVHVTSKNMSVQRQSGIARYTGGARLWQGANIVEAPAIEFDSGQRTIVAQGTNLQPVSSVFVQADKTGKTTPAVVTAAKLAYADSDRKARYSGGVLVKGADVRLTADHIDVLLQPATQQQQANSAGPSQLQQIIADERIVIQQPTRRATGEKLVYTASDGKFVLTGGPPVVTDTERGVIKGDSLTFFSRDDRVIVESAGSSRTVTRTRIKQ